jgi:glycosyltransferase involved in cell wall biosynthesis
MGTGTVSVIVATFGDERWRDLAERRAIPSARAAIERRGADAEILAVHLDDGPLAYARNEAAAVAVGEWLCFLDADDELEPGYLDALLAPDRWGDLRAPAVRFLDDATIPDPVTLDDRDIRHLNPCVIGTLIRRDMFHEAGGFWGERAWEDWSLFRRAWLLGAKIEHVRGAVYAVHVDPTGRNSTVDRPRALHRDIIQTHTRWRREKGLIP